MINTRKRSAVSRVRKVAGKLFSMPSSSMPPKGGLVTITGTRSFVGVIFVGHGLRVLSCRMMVVGVSMPCRIMLVTQSMWGKCFFIDPADGGLQGLFVLGGLDVMFAFVLDGAGEKAAGAAGRVEHGFIKLGVDAVDDEFGDGAGGIKLAGIAGALQVLEESARRCLPKVWRSLWVLKSISQILLITWRIRVPDFM